MLGLEMARSYVAGDRGFGTGERFFFNTSAHLVKSNNSKSAGTSVLCKLRGWT